MATLWLARMERRLGSWAIPQLASLLVALNAAVWVLTLLKPEFPSRLILDPEMILHGEFWRAVTFLFIPPPMAPLWMFFWLYLFYLYAQALEHAWGDFRFNLFYLIGAVATILASLALGTGLSNIPLHTSLFLAFAAMFPDFELLLFFFIPVKVKWMAAFAWAAIALNFLFGGTATRLALASSLANYALFFGRDHWGSLRLRLQTWRNRRRFRRAIRGERR